MPTPIGQNGFDARLDIFGEINAIALENALDQILPPETKTTSAELQSQGVTNSLDSFGLNTFDAEETGSSELFGDAASFENTSDNDDNDLLDDIVARVIKTANEDAAALTQNELGIVPTFDLGGGATSFQPDELDFLQSLTRLDYDF